MRKMRKIFPKFILSLISGGGPRTSIQFDPARKLNPDQVIETVSASDVYVETLPFRSSLSVASSSTTSGVLTKSPTSGYRNTSGTEPSWTEGTPSYTPSSSDSNSSEGNLSDFGMFYSIVSLIVH